MSPAEAITLGQEAVKLSLILSAPLLLVGMLVGIVIAVFQATTQIQEMTLTFVPKIFAVMLALLFFASWMLSMLTDYTAGLINSIPDMIR